MTPRRPQRRRPMRDHGRPARQPPRPARGAPGPGSRAPPPCCAGSTPSSSTTPAGTPASPPAPPAASTPRRRPPDQRFHPAPATGARDLLPDEEESEPVPASGTNPACHPGQLSPGRPDLLTSSVERCRGRPARELRRPAEPACTTWSEKTRVTGTRNRPAERSPSRRGTSACPQPGRRRPRTHASQAAPAPAVAKTHSSEATSRNHQKTLPNHLTDSLLRWCYTFNAVGIELGYRYERGAVVPGDESYAPSPDPDLVYVPQTAVGCALPRAVVTDPAGRQQSTIDLVTGGAFHLLTGPGGEAWSAVCDEIAHRTGLDIRVTEIGPGCPFGDPYGEWQRIRGISDSGAVLVRPDGHVAWRADTAGEEQFQALRTAVAALLGHDAAQTTHADRLETVA